jgi:hypothetical protein
MYDTAQAQADHFHAQATGNVAQQYAHESTDLAVADRVAFVLACRTGMEHAVYATTDRYVVLATPVAPHALPAGAQLTSTASAHGVVPVVMGT